MYPGILKYRTKFTCSIVQLYAVIGLHVLHHSGIDLCQSKITARQRDAIAVHVSLRMSTR